MRCFTFINTQTWQDPRQFHSETNAKGDNNPLGVCEIGEDVGYVGQVKQVKVLGAMAIITNKQIEWKIIVVDVLDPNAQKLNDIGDVERLFPTLITATRDWLKCVRIPCSSVRS